VNNQIQEQTRRQNEVEARVEQTMSRTITNEQRIEKLTQDVNRLQLALEAEREERNNFMCDELRDRETRKNNLVIHGIPEADGINYNRDRMEHDRNTCGAMFRLMGVRTRPEDLRFCRRVGQRGQDPRPVIIGIRSEEVRRD
jgi:hypothetical protein